MHNHRSCSSLHYAHVSLRAPSCAKLPQPECGQGTVEAAVIIPSVLLTLLLLIQPGILLYDRLVMQAAAAEGCRLLATKTDKLGAMDEACKAFIRHRLASVPPADCFHMHSQQCSWDIQLTGDETSDSVRVTIGNDVKALPLVNAATCLLGLADKEGKIHLESSVEMAVQPEWIAHAPAGKDPDAWIGAWS